MKRHVQQEIRWENKAGDLRGRKREAKPRGKRAIGRPKKKGAGMPHVKRPALKAGEPIHITIRVAEVIGRLRTRDAYMAIREAAIAVFRREDFRIVHLSIEGTHIHLLVEAEHRVALSNGMRAFQGSAAKHLNAAVSKAGSWWERKRAARLGHALPDVLSTSPTLPVRHQGGGGSRHRHSFPARAGGLLFASAGGAASGDLESNFAADRNGDTTRA